jgi:hypothetical protein
LGVFAVVAAGGPEYELSRFTIDGGGVMRSTGGDFELSGTIGQPDAGSLTGGDVEVTGGFWFSLTPADCNEDGFVNSVDHAAFTQCVGGPDVAATAGCECFDVDASGTVDLRDFAAIQKVFSPQ